MLSARCEEHDAVERLIARALASSVSESDRRIGEQMLAAASGSHGGA